MSLLDKIKMEDPFPNSKLELSPQDVVDAGACGICWGKQEYEGKFIDYVKDKEKDVINHDRTAQKAFVAQFIEERVTGIKLQNQNNKKVCKVCNSEYAKRLTS